MRHKALRIEGVASCDGHECPSYIAAISVAPGNSADGTRNTEGDHGHPIIVQRVGCVGPLMIIWISQKAGVRQHQCRKSVEPEAAVVGKMNLRDSFRQHDGKQRKARRLFETASKLPAEFPRTRIRDRRQKIASCRKQPSQPFRDSRWQLLRILFIDEEANHLNNLRQNEQLS